MNTNLKAILLAIYALAIVGLLGVLPPALASALAKIALILVVAHVLELAIAFKAVKRHPGPLIDSIALTLLFGILHWRPLSRAK
jgi:uncharacterized protein YhhL (DUF1145 family)